MDISRKDLMEKLLNTNPNISVECLINSVIRFCQNNPAAVWKYIFKEGIEREQVVSSFLEQGGVVIHENICASPTFSRNRVSMCFRSGSSEFLFLLGLMYVIYRKLEIKDPVEAVFGKYTLTLNNLLDKSSFWSRPLADTVLRKRKYSSAEGNAIKNLKLAIGIIKASIEEANDLFPKTVSEALMELEKCVIKYDD